MAKKKDNVTSKFKDNVFCMLYRDKRNLLELYNALNNSAYTNVDDLQVTTLNGGSYMKYKNDASFLLCMSLYMFEQHREEVVEVSIYDYDEEEVRRVLAKEMAEEMAQEVAQELVEKAAKEASEKAFAEGEQLKIVNLVIKKVKKSKTLEAIASELEEEVEDIKPIYEAVVGTAPDYDIEIIKDRLGINSK